MTPKSLLSNLIELGSEFGSVMTNWNREVSEFLTMEFTQPSIALIY